MVSKSYKFKEGIAVTTGLMLLGLLLQWVVGPVDWSLIVFPVNIIALAVFVTMLVFMYSLRNKVYAFRWTMQYTAAIPALLFCASVTLFHGLTNWSKTLENWSFVIIYMWITCIVGLVCIKRFMMMVTRSEKKNASYYIDNVSFLLNHLGLFIAITAATLGNADIRRATLQLEEGQQEWRAVEQDTHMVIDLPMYVHLDHFTLETYPNGEPKRFASDVTITTDGKTNPHTIEVNKPLKVAGWSIYQYSYEIWDEDSPRISVFKLVRDPWLPVVYLGIYMMIGGAMMMFCRQPRTSQKGEKEENKNIP